MEKKELLVLLPRDEDRQKALEALAADRCNIAWLPEDAPQAEMEAALAKAEIVLGAPPPALLPGAKNLRLVQTTWAGVGQYLGVLDQRYTLCNMSGAYGVVIAEYMMAQVLGLCRRLPAYLDAQKQGAWQDLGPEKSLEGAVALVLGAGDIGTRFAERLAPFGARVIGVRRTPRPYAAPFSGMITLAELDTWLPQADIIACCLPETAETKGLLNEARLAAMKADAVLVNAGRGSLIDTDALVRALENGRFLGVGLDVTDPEPLPPQHPLWRCPRTVITPHISGLAFGHLPQTLDRIWAISLDNLARYLSGAPLRNVIDASIGY